MKTRTLALGALLLLPSAALAAEPSSNPFARPSRPKADPAPEYNPFSKPHKAAETPVPSGWAVIRSDEQDFQAALPKGARRTEDGGERSVTYTARLDDARWLAVTVTRLPASRLAEATPSEVLRAAGAEAAERNDLQVIRQFPAGLDSPESGGPRHKGLDVTLGNEDTRPMRYLRLYLVGDTLYQLVFEGPRGSSREPFEALVKHFQLTAR